MSLIMEPLGDSALRIVFSNYISVSVNQYIRKVSNFLKDHRIDGLIEWVPTYTGITLHYDPSVITYNRLKDIVSDLNIQLLENDALSSKTFKIPVCYGGEYGPDLKTLADRKNLSEEEVIYLHSNRDYLIYMLGFTPGFPYLGGMDEKLATPRLDVPRTFVKEGSVGIAGAQTGIYSVNSPGGWNIIGRTPLKLFEPDKNDPVLLEEGCYIRFYPITPQLFEEISEKVQNGEYQAD